MAITSLQRNGLNGISLLCLLGAGTMIAQNFPTPVTAALITSSGEVSLGMLLLIIAALITLSVGLPLWAVILNQSTSQSQVNRKAERLAVTAESSSEKVKALEQKVQTLEKALQTALASTQRGQV